jgi:hypothetical protein
MGKNSIIWAIVCTTLIGFAVGRRSVNTTNPNIDALNTDKYQKTIDSLNTVDSVLTLREFDIKRRDSLLTVHFDSLEKINKAKYEKAIGNIDTLSTDELIRIFSVEISNEVEDW